MLLRMYCQKSHRSCARTTLFNSPEGPPYWGRLTAGRLDRGPGGGYSAGGNAARMDPFRPRNPIGISLGFSKRGDAFHVLVRHHDEPDHIRREEVRYDDLSTAFFEARDSADDAA